MELVHQPAEHQQHNRRRGMTYALRSNPWLNITVSYLTMCWAGEYTVDGQGGRGD